MSGGATVTQADRDAAASITAMAELREMVAGGDYDEHAYVQAFARHRTAAEAASAGMVAELGGAIMACAALMDAAEMAIDGRMADLDQQICCNGHHCGCRGSTNRELLAHDLRETARLARAHTTSEGEG